MLVILDRDGVINVDSDDYVKSPDEWIPIPGSLAAIARLNKAGHQVVVATNQSGIGRGKYTEAVLHAMHDKFQQLLAAHGGHIDKIYYCPHHPDDNCDCRKPKAGMLKHIAKDFKVDLTECVVIGDSLRDIQAAQLVHCPAWLVLTGKGQGTYDRGELPSDIKVFPDLEDAVNALL